MNSHPMILNWLNNELSSNPLLSNITKIQNITKENLGLTNEIFIIQAETVDNSTQTFFMKKFGLSSDNIFNRPFEAQITKLLSLENLIPKTIASDLLNYRIEEYIHDLSSPSNEELFNHSFLQKLIEIIIQQQLTCQSLLFSQSNPRRTIWSYFDTIIPLAQDKFTMFKEFMSMNMSENNEAFKQESIDIISYILFNEGFMKIYKSLCNDENIKELWEEDNLVFAHNDVHKGNIIQSPSSGLMLIDHEYACFNVIGFDIVNYCIESFFALDLKEYPFYGLKSDIGELFTDDKYYLIYLSYIDIFLVNFPRFKSKEVYLKNKSYYSSLAGLCSLFWFYSGLVFIDYDSNINMTGFNMIDYVVDRLKIYTYVNNSHNKPK